MQDFPINVDGRGKNTRLWEKAAAWNIFRLRNHPSLVLWCGGNEFCAETGDSAPLIVIAANLIRNLDGSREFMESSPVNGDWHIYPSFTDAARLWDTVLADGPFISECGARCMPSPETWEKLLSGESFRAVPGDTVYAPEKMARLYPEISHFCMEYPEEMFRRGEKFNRIREIPLAELSEAVNLAAAEFNRIAIEVCRCAWPQNGGLLLWAWKRPWPSVACQLVDGARTARADLLCSEARVRAIAPLSETPLAGMYAGRKFDLAPVSPERRRKRDAKLPRPPPSFLVTASGMFFRGNETGTPADGRCTCIRSSGTAFPHSGNLPRLLLLRGSRCAKTGRHARPQLLYLPLHGQRKRPHSPRSARGNTRTPRTSDSETGRTADHSPDQKFRKTPLRNHIRLRS